MVLKALAPKQNLRLLEAAPPFKLDRVEGTTGYWWTLSQEHSTLLSFLFSAVALIAVQRTSVFCAVYWDGWSHLGLGTTR